MFSFHILGTINATAEIATPLCHRRGSTLTVGTGQGQRLYRKQALILGGRSNPALHPVRVASGKGVQVRRSTEKAEHEQLKKSYDS